MASEAHANSQSDVPDLPDYEHDNLIAQNNVKSELRASNGLVTFDSAALFGNSNSVDLSRFQVENYIASESILLRPILMIVKLAIMSLSLNI